MNIGLGLAMRGLRYYNRAVPLPLPPSVLLLGNEPEGMAIDFTQDSMVIRDRAVSANNFIGSPNGKLSYVSPSIKYVRNKQGILVPGTTIRCDYEIDGNPLGALIESQSTNFILRSEEFDNWIKRGSVSVTPNVEFAPDGQMTADLVSGISTSVNDIYLVSSGHAASATLAPSIFMKRVSTSGLIYLQNSANTSLGRWSINLGLISNNWERITSDHPAVTVATPWIATAGGTAGIHIAGQSGGPLSFHLWGAMLEQATFTSSYIKTEATQVTRQPDVISLSTSAFPFNFAEGSLLVEADTITSGGTVVRVPMMLTHTANNGNNRIQPYFYPSRGGLVITTGGVAQGDMTTGGEVVVDRLMVKLATGYKTDDCAKVLGAYSIVTDNSVTLPVDISQMNFGRGPSSANHLSGHLRSGVYLPRRMSNSELQAWAA